MNLLNCKVLSKSKFSKEIINKSYLVSNILHNRKNLERLDQFSTLKNDFESQNFEMFEEVDHNFGKFDSDII